MSVGNNGSINTVYNVGKIKEESKYSLGGSKPVADSTATMRSLSSKHSISKTTENVNREISEDADIQYSDRYESEYLCVLDNYLTIDCKQI